MYFKCTLACNLEQQGVGNPDVVRALKGLIFSESPMVVFLMETRRKSHEIQRMRRTFGVLNVYSVDCRGESLRRAGGLTPLWHENAVVDIVSSSAHHISLWLKLPEINAHFFASRIYGYPEQENKRRTLSLIRQLEPEPNDTWLCFGGFNYLLEPEDKLGGANLNHEDLSSLQAVVADFSL